MTFAAMGMTPAIVGREELVQRGQQVFLRAASGLDNCEAGGCMRHEHVHQAVAADRARRFGHLAGDVDDTLPIASAHLESRGLHEAEA